MIEEEIKNLYIKLSKILTKKEKSILNQMRQELWIISDDLTALYISPHLSDYRKNSLQKLHEKINQIPVFYGKDELGLYGWKKKDD